jgi:hypothetical protein
MIVAILNAGMAKIVDVDLILIIVNRIMTVAPKFQSSRTGLGPFEVLQQKMNAH